MRQFQILLLSIVINFFIFLSTSNSEIIKKITISGNERISDETILMFSDINIDQDLKNSEINTILKNLYDTNFFKNVSVNFNNNLLLIDVDEAPIIEDILITGVKDEKYIELIKDNFTLRPRSSFNEFLLSQQVKSIETALKLKGFYFAKVDPYIEILDNNFVIIEYKIDLGDKAKIGKISFIGDKIYKDKKLHNVIVSEEYKFWKFISGKKYLQEELIGLDKRLLKNFYLNNGFYNVKINTSFAKLINDSEFELIFNIDPGKKIYFNDMNIVLPKDFDNSNYINLADILKKLKGNAYSINSVEKILDEVDKITLEEEFKSVKAFVEEKIVEDKLDMTFIIEESEKYFVERINVLGNNITRENVIRNQLELDEGDPYSEILAKKSENNIKSLNFFKTVQTSVIDGIDKNSKIINFQIEEKATGEISAGAGAGTEGGTLQFGIRENNYLGKGLSVDGSAFISKERFKGIFGVTNPNFNNTDKTLFVNVQSIEINQLTNYGYKTNKTGLEIGTSFEYFADFDLGLGTSTFFERIETDKTASARQKAQGGNYWDTFVKFDFDFDKRNQKFKTTEGFRSYYSLDVPLMSETNTLTNSYNYKFYSELYEDNTSIFSVFLKSSTSISGDSIKLSERLVIPSNKLRGFKNGKVGPKDGADFIGGNFLATINVQSSLPHLFANSQTVDAIIFFDAANIWGVDYDSSLNDDDGSEIRSSIGIGIDWFTAIGPLNFSFSEVISKKKTDEEESFRFNLGTTF